jgi:hypothetical protein
VFPGTQKKEGGWKPGVVKSVHRDDIPGTKGDLYEPGIREYTMATLREVREYLSRYHQGDVPNPKSSNQQNTNQNSASLIFDHQRDIFGTADEHLIPYTDYEIRIGGSDDDLDSKTDHFRIEDAIGTVERAWDELIEEHGLDCFSTYIPFHEDQEESGIYIRQQGIRFLGHLLYQWSRAAAKADTPEKQAEILRENRLQESNQLLFEPPAFDSVEEAVQLAQEIIVRYQWFHHQIELLSAYIEDTTGESCYQEYRERLTNDQSTGPSLPERLAVASVFRSSACANKAPESIGSRVLIYRAFSPRFQSFQQLNEDATSRFKQDCRELAAELSSIATSEHPRSVYGGFGEQLPFSRDPFAASPDQVPIYITRNEFDSDNGTYGKGIPLDEDWEIDCASDWEKTYDKVDNTLQNRADNAISKLEDNVRHGGFNWKPCQPDDQFYFRLNKQLRGIAKIDNQDQKVTLIDFGKHEEPQDFGCYSS